MLTIFRFVILTVSFCGLCYAGSYDTSFNTEYTVTFKSPADIFEVNYIGYTNTLTNSNPDSFMKIPVGEFQVKTGIPRKIAVGFGSDFQNKIQPYAEVLINSDTGISNSIMALFSFGYGSTLSSSDWVSSLSEKTNITNVDGKAYSVTNEAVMELSGKIHVLTMNTKPDFSGSDLLTSGRFTVSITAAVYND